MNSNIKHSNIVLFSSSSDLADGVMTGTVYYKQIVKFGKWVNPLFPIEYMELDRKWAEKLVSNFNSKIIDKVPVPLDHTDQVDRNAGEVIKLEIKNDGVYAYLDIRRPEVVQDIDNGLIFDVSISFDWNYTDTSKGNEHGPVLLHVALVNNPYLKGMKPFEQTAEQFNNNISEALALSTNNSAIMLSEAKAKELNIMPTVKNDKEFEVIITVTNEAGEEVEHVLAAGDEIEVPEGQEEAVAKQIAEAVEASDESDESGEEAGDGEENAEEGEGSEAGEEAGEEAGDAMAQEDVAEQLSEARRKLAEYELSEKYYNLLQEGKITPAQKDKFMALSNVSNQTIQLSDKQEVSVVEAVVSILEAGPKVLDFSESGSASSSEGGEANADATKSDDELTAEEKAGMQAVGASPERFKELSEKYPDLMAVSIPSKSENEA